MEIRHQDLLNARYGRRASRGVRRLLILFGLFSAVLIGISVFAAAKSYEQRVEQAERLTMNAAETLHQHMLRAVEAADQALLRVTDRVRPMTWDAAQSSEDIWDFVNSLADQLPQVRFIWLADETGRVRIYSARFRPSNSDVSKGETFNEAKKLKDGFFISNPVFGGPPRRHYFTLSRRMVTEKGGFKGVVAAAIEPDYFTDFHKTFSLGDYGEIAVFKTSGIMLGRHPYIQEAIGNKTVQHRTLSEVAANQTSGTYYDRQTRNQVPRVLSYHRVGGLPLVISAAQSTRDITRFLWRDLRLLLLAVAVSLAFMSFLFCAFLRNARREHENRLRTEERELVFRSIINNAGSGIAMVAQDGSVRLANPKLLAMFGYAEDEILGKKFNEFLHPEHRASGLSISRLFKGEIESFSIERSFLKKNGDSIWLTVSASLKPAQEGLEALAVCVVQDISERIRIEREIARSEFKFRTVANFTRDLEFWLKPDRTFEYISPACLRITGRRAEEFLDDPGLFQDMVLAEDRPAFLRELEHGFSSRTGGELDFRIAHKDLGVRWVSLGYEVIKDAEGEMSGLRGSIRDISQKKEMEALREDMERITRHDLKGPAMSTVMACRLLRKKGPLNNDQSRLVEELEALGFRMLNMINESLSLFKMEAGAYVFEPQRLDLIPVLSKAVQDLSSALRVKDLTILKTLNGRPLSDKDRFQVLGEEALCYSMFSNLLKNAIEASPEGEYVGIQFANTGRKEVRIANKGLVPEDVRDRFFDKYSTSGKRYGTGLGTFAARLISETHGGGVRLITDQARGETAVAVFFPDAGLKAGP
ncbi:MAG: PAS domain S-box protein [Desulfovibrionaceae bacterium]|nr:PAS domain S-box protein [Desulfovibrionaceae bacterium]